MADGERPGVENGAESEFQTRMGRLAREVDAAYEFFSLDANGDDLAGGKEFVSGCCVVLGREVREAYKNGKLVLVVSVDKRGRIVDVKPLHGTPDQIALLLKEGAESSHE